MRRRALPEDEREPECRPGPERNDPEISGRGRADSDSADNRGTAIGGRRDTHGARDARQCGLRSRSGPSLSPSARAVDILCLHSIAGDGIGRAELPDRDQRTVKSTPDTGVRNISAPCSDGAQNNSSDWLFPGNDVWCGLVEWLFIEDGVTMADKGKNPKKPAKSLKERRQENRQKAADAGEFIRKRKRS